MLNHEYKIFGISFSSNESKSFLATAGEYGDIFVWNLEITNKKISLNNGWISGIDFSSDESLALIASTHDKEKVIFIFYELIN